MRRNLLAAFLIGSLFALAAQAQNPQKPAVGAAPATETPSPAPGQEPDPRIIEDIVSCLAEGLPEGWKKTWFVIEEISREAGGATRQYEVKFFYATDPNDRTGKRLNPCGTNRIIDGVIALNDYLQPSQRRWTGVTMTFMIDGSYDAAYDYKVSTPAPATAKPAAKPAAKK